MTDIRYKIDRVKHKFAKAVIKNENLATVTTAFLGGFIGYVALDKTEDNIATNSAKQVVAELKLKYI